MKIRGKIVATGLIASGVLGTVAVVNKITEALAGELSPGLAGEGRRYPWKYGDVFYTIQGPREAKPVVLVHGLGPGASSYEWRRNLEVLAQDFRVYALDLLGFGLSDRPAIAYEPQIFSDLISDFLREAVRAPALVAARGLSGAYAIADAYRHPGSYERLVLVSPPATMLEEPSLSPLRAALRLGLRLPLVGQFAYNVVTTRRAIRNYYEERAYYDPSLISDELIEYAYISAHQPDARFPVADLLAGNLHADVSEPLARLTVPVMALWGQNGAGTSAAFKRVNPQIETHVLERCGEHLQEEQPETFHSLLRSFVGSAV
ncbi:alpha/beta fold hydrolase [Thermogemmatispora onikobensis]|uniref:alpha/beta fold hydrolase n=1 Tax=Thermogemmatispora onikobensis TaxID=732234 RepID=UPI000852B46B|nr:alpha/beta fold hydrolase [Thermogemmatispora onikobensis]